MEQIHQDVKKLIGCKVKYGQDRTTIHEFEKRLSDSTLDNYLYALNAGFIEWESKMVNIPGSYSVNAYRSGRRGKDAEQSEHCWVLVETSKKVAPKVISSGLYSRCRFLYRNHAHQFSDWERGFVINMGSLLGKGKSLSRKQQEFLEKILKKYKVPEDAIASEES